MSRVRVSLAAIAVVGVLGIVGLTIGNSQSASGHAGRGGHAAHMARQASSAQQAPPPCVRGVTIQQLGVTSPDAAEGQSLTLRRVTIEPGGGLGPHTHPGTIIVSVESGAFGLTLVDGEMEMTRAAENGAEAVTEMMMPGQEVALQAGDWFVEGGMVHAARAIGDEPAVVVLSGLVAADQPFVTCIEDGAAT